MSSPNSLHESGGATSSRKRLVLLVTGAVFGGVIAAVGFVVFSLWIEDRYPSSDRKRAISPTVQRAITKPIVDGVNRQVSAYLRKKIEMAYMYPSLSLEEILRRFSDARIDPSQRRLFAFRLARVGTPTCLNALARAFETAAPNDKAVMAQLIGSTGNPAVKGLLWSLSKDPDEGVKLAAIAGLSAIGGEDVTARLAGMLADGQLTETFRVQAALGLGTIGTSRAREALVDSLNQKPSSELTIQILNSLGRFEYETVAFVFERYLAPGTAMEIRSAAVEALALSTNEAVPVLVGLAQNDTTEDVRSSAAWAISTHNNAKDLGPTLTEMIERESAADVRRRLYEAMLPQDEIPVSQLLPIIQGEEDIAARIAGFNVVGRAVFLQQGTQLAADWDRLFVPELLQIATAPNSLDIQMRAVFALRMAQTPLSLKALIEIANQGAPKVANAARHGLPDR